MWGGGVGYSYIFQQHRLDLFFVQSFEFHLFVGWGSWGRGCSPVWFPWLSHVGGTRSEFAAVRGTVYERGKKKFTSEFAR